MTTGERIKAARIHANLTQSELADKVGVKFSAIHKYESGLVVNLKRDTIDALAKALDVSPVYLLGYSDSFDGSENTQSKADELLEIFNRLSPENQEKILELTRLYIAAQDNK